MANPTVLESLNVDDQPELDSKVTKGRFEGKVVVISGGAGGMGSATAARFLNDGAAGVAIVDLNSAAAEKLLRDSPRFSDAAKVGRARFYKADVSRREEAFRVVDEVFDDFGRIDFLVNSVGYFRCSGLTSDDAQWAESMRINVAGFAFMGQACYRHMKTNGGGGAIVNTSSISAHQAQADRWTYCAAKGAVDILTKCMALDMAPGKVRVNSISPGWIWSPEVAKAKPADFVGRSNWESSVIGSFHINGRMGEMAEVAAVTAFLCSKDAAFVNGSDVKVDGGYGAMSAEGMGENSVFAGAQA